MDCYHPAAEPLLLHASPQVASKELVPMLHTAIGHNLVLGRGDFVCASCKTTDHVVPKGEQASIWYGVKPPLPLMTLWRFSGPMLRAIQCKGVVPKPWTSRKCFMAAALLRDLYTITSRACSLPSLKILTASFSLVLHWRWDARSPARYHAGFRNRGLAHAWGATLAQEQKGQGLHLPVEMPVEKNCHSQVTHCLCKSSMQQF